MADLIRALRSSEIDLVLCEINPPEASRRGLEIAMADQTTLVAVVQPAIEPAPDRQNLSLLQYRASSSSRAQRCRVAAARSVATAHVSR